MYALATDDTSIECQTCQHAYPPRDMFRLTSGNYLCGKCWVARQDALRREAARQEIARQAKLGRLRA